MVKWISTLAAPLLVIIINLSGSFLRLSHAFTSSHQRHSTTSRTKLLRMLKPDRDDSTVLQTKAIASRRKLLQLLPISTVIFGRHISSANAAVETAGEKVITMTPDEAKIRLKDAQKSLEYLLDHWDEISNVGGDNVRRYLGTVGTSSGMYGITKAMKIVQAQASDIVEYTETMNEVNACINGADGSAYMAIFVTSSTSYTPPQKYFDEAKIETKRALKALNDLSKVID